jgi:predicted nucleic acid-binding protein
VIVIADTSVVSNLAIIGKADLLPKVYGEIMVPTFVWKELQNGAKIHSPLDSVLREGWLLTHAIKNRLAVEALMPELHEGEAQAIVLAQELHAELLLMDERHGRRVAKRLGLNLTGLLGVLLQAKARGLISSVRPCIEELQLKARFWMRQDVLNDCLRRAGELPRPPSASTTSNIAPAAPSSHRAGWDSARSHSRA